MASSVKVGDKVKCSAERDWNGTHLASFVRTNTYDVIQVGGKNLSNNRVVIGKGKAVTAAVHIKYLTVINKNSVKKTDTKKKSNKKKNTKKKLSDDELAANALKGKKDLRYAVAARSIDGSKVQTVDGYKDPSYGLDDAINLEDIPSEYIQSAEMTAYEKKLDQSHPEFVQNNKKFPKISKKPNGNLNRYVYNYTINAADTLAEGSGNNTAVSLQSNIKARKSVNAGILTRNKLYEKYTKKYNRYKVNMTNDQLMKTFAHVFFVRPDCNIFKYAYNNRDNVKLTKALNNLSEFYYASKHCPDILRQLTQSKANYGHEFMMYPSNKARSFEIADEYIGVDTYGKALTGYNIPYGKSNVESRASSKFSINYIDDRDLHIYNLHKLWIDYTSYVYRGKVSPIKEYITNKNIDYATCVYYIVCAEDGETIIFWSKYWGVFPLEAPSSSFSYNIENGGTMKQPELKIEYQYAWKEDFNPLSLVEFNSHTKGLGTKYIKTYQPSKLGTGYTWAGMPFIETVNNKKSTIDLPYTFKLRFRDGDPNNTGV